MHEVYKRVCEKRNLTALDLSEFLSLANLVSTRGILRVVGKNHNRLSKVGSVLNKIILFNHKTIVIEYFFKWLGFSNIIFSGMYSELYSVVRRYEDSVK